MRIGTMVAAALLAGIGLHAGGQARATDFNVPVCMDSDYQSTEELRNANLSKGIASRILGRFGVKLIWVDARSCPPEGIRISLTDDTPNTMFPGAMAYALPFEGTH